MIKSVARFVERFPESRMYALIPWVMTAIVVLVLVIRDMVPAGALAARYDFQHASPYLSRLSPDGRVLPIEQTEKGEFFQRMVIDPVYVDVRLPGPFELARVSVWYRKKAETALRIGFRTESFDWSWHIEDVVPVEQQGEWTYGEALLHLKEASYDGQVLHLILSSPGLAESGESIALHRIEAAFMREPASWNMSFLRVYARTWI